MDINGFKTKVLSINEEALSLAKKVTNKSYLENLNDLITSLKELVEFVKDDLNISVLDNYLRKSKETSDSCPLDCLSKNVLDKLEE